MSIPDPYGAVPDWPKVSATIAEDGTAEVTINGSPRTVLTGGGDVDQARAAVLEHLSVQTAGLGRPRRVAPVAPAGPARPGAPPGAGRPRGGAGRAGASRAPRTATRCGACTRTAGCCPWTSSPPTAPPAPGSR